SAAPPDVTAQVDRARVPAGEELTLTIRARSRSAEPVALTLPGLTGFTIVASREVTEVTLEGVGGPVRTMTREVRLKTQRPGTLVIGPVRVRQGLRDIATPPLTVTVDSAAAGLATAVSPIARRLIAAAPPPAHNHRVALSLILPGESVPGGQPPCCRCLPRAGLPTTNRSSDRGSVSIWGSSRRTVAWESRSR